jgi:hypothetical protein
LLASLRNTALNTESQGPPLVHSSLSTRFTFQYIRNIISVLTYSDILKKVERVSTETLLKIYQTQRCNIPDDSNLHIHRHDTLKSHREKRHFRLLPSTGLTRTSALLRFCCQTWNGKCCLDYLSRNPAVNLEEDVGGDIKSPFLTKCHIAISMDFNQGVCLRLSS